MKKLLFISPHLSTGGLPQYLLKKIKSLINDYEIICVEYNNYTGGVLVVQREQIVELCKSNFYTLGENKYEIIDIINQVNPSIIHFEEMPEYFMDMNLALKIYNPDRNYLIVETSHDSSFDKDKKRVFPDQFIFVSKYQKQNLESLDVKSGVIEYPISVKLRKNREEGLKFLGLDPNKKHVFHVGLFTPRKNQKEFMDYAREMENENVQFHCIGNMADNFKFYWEPLIKNVPKNLKVWGERKDVNNFYSCMDLFLFTSRGHANDKETAPIVIKEAISFNVPSLLYNLPVYLNKYNQYSNIDYLDEQSFNKNVNTIKKKLNLSFEDKKLDVTSIENLQSDTLRNDVIIVSSHPSMEITEKTTISCLNQLKKFGYKVILTSHCPVSKNIQDLSDYTVFDKNNPILKHNFYNQWNYSDSKLDIFLNFKSCGSDDYHGLAVLLNYYNGISLAKYLGFKNAICLNYDLIINDQDLEKLNHVKNVLNNKKGFFFYEKAAEGDTLKTVFHGININFYLDQFKYYNPREYMDIVNNNNCSNGLEQFYYNKLIQFKDDLEIDYVNNEETFFDKSKTNLFSMVEYLTVLPDKKNNKFFVFSYFNNSIDNRFNKMTIKKNNEIIKEEIYQITNKAFYFISEEFVSENSYQIENEILDVKNNTLKKYIKSFSNLEEISINGHIQFKQ